MIKKITLLIAGLISAIMGLYGQNSGAWGFVGPYSNNNNNGQEFETSHMNSLAIDPNDALHIFSCSKFGGLWESTDGGANWFNVSTNSTGLSGVLGIAFRNSSELLVGNYHPNFRGDYSSNVSLYNFVAQTWSNLATLPPAAYSYVIKSVAVHPGNPSVIFACTSAGLMRSADAGVSWTAIASATGCIENMVFMPKPGGYYCYIAGSDAVGDHEYPLGHAMLKESSDDGVTFSDISATLVINHTTYVRTHSKVCLGPANAVTGNRELLTLTVATSGQPERPYGWDGAPSQAHYVHRLTKNVNTATAVSYVSTPFFSNQHPSSDRMAIAYDEYNGLCWFGGITMYGYDLVHNVAANPGKTSFRTLGCYVHADQHEYVVHNNAGVYTMYVACDGGIAKASLSLGTTPLGYPNAASVCFNRLNNGLNVCLINGFSGCEQEPNIYALGAQDIINTDIYDESIQQNKYTLATWENDGALINKHDKQMMVLDGTSYSPDYYVSWDGGASMNYDGVYLPNSTGPFESSGTPFSGATSTFGAQRFRQDPYRPGRIFSLGHYGWPHFLQMDMNTGQFVLKAKFDAYPNVYWSPNTTDMSFSPQTPNSVHVITSSRYYPSYSESFASTVLKYVGPDFSDSWPGHNEYYAGAQPQWQDISPNLLSFSTVGGGAVNIVTADFGKVTYQAIETSPWNKDLIYVGCNINIPGNEVIKVLRYDGSAWSDYSAGIPADELVYTMVMDHASYDGIYLTTDKGVYYRNPIMSSWISYSNGLPILFSKQMEVNYNENTVRIGTYGMGIWKSDLQCPRQQNLSLTGTITQKIYEADYITASGSVSLTAGLPTACRATGSVVLNPGFQVTGGTTSNTYFLAFIHGCINSGTSPSFYRGQFISPYTGKAEEEEAEKIESEKDGLSIYPNPSTGVFTIETEDDAKAVVEIYNMKGEKIKAVMHKGFKSIIELTDAPKGIYLVRISSDDKKISRKIVVE